MSTIGYGDIFPASNIERLFCIAITLIACGIFAYAVNMIGTIFQEKAQKEAGYNKKKFIAQQFMEIRNISQTQQVKVLKYLEYQFEQDQKQGNIQKGQDVLLEIPKNIREEVLMEFYSNILMKCKVLKRTFSKKFIQKLSLKMREIQLCPQEELYKSGQISDENCNFYYIYKGQMEIQWEVCNKQDVFETQTLNQGQYFGDEEFFTNKLTRNDSVKSIGVSHLVYLRKQDFLEMVLEHNLQYENYILLQESYLNNQCSYQANSSIKCKYCQSKFHISLFCPVVHRIPDQYLTIARYQENYKQTQQRSNSNQKQRKLKINFRRKKIKESAKRIRKSILNTEVNYVNLDDIYNQIEISTQENDEQQFLTLLPAIRFKKDGDYYVENIEQYFNDLEELENREHTDRKCSQSSFVSISQNSESFQYSNSISDYSSQTLQNNSFVSGNKLNSIQLNSQNEPINQLDNFMQKSKASLKAQIEINQDSKKNWRTSLDSLNQTNSRGNRKKSSISIQGHKNKQQKAVQINGIREKSMDLYSDSKTRQKKKKAQFSQDAILKPSLKQIDNQTVQNLQQQQKRRKSVSKRTLMKSISRLQSIISRKNLDQSTLNSQENLDSENSQKSMSNLNQQYSNSYESVYFKQQNQNLKNEKNSANSSINQNSSSYKFRNSKSQKSKLTDEILQPQKIQRQAKAVKKTILLQNHKGNENVNYVNQNHQQNINQNQQQNLNEKPQQFQQEKTMENLYLQNKLEKQEQQCFSQKVKNCNSNNKNSILKGGFMLNNYNNDSYFSTLEQFDSLKEYAHYKTYANYSVILARVESKRKQLFSSVFQKKKSPKFAHSLVPQNKDISLFSQQVKLQFQFSGQSKQKQ